MDWQRTTTRHPGVQRLIIAIVLACVVTTMPVPHVVHLRTLHASAVHVDAPPGRIPGTKSTDRPAVPAAVDLEEDVDRRDRQDRGVSSRAPRVTVSRALPISAPVSPARDQSQILRI